MNQTISTSKFFTSLVSSSFFSRLYRWFEENQRELPWRKNRNPYRVWISEIMLQQTRSETVKEYYLRWMRFFPTLKSLGVYSDRTERENQILSLWQGLGYYRRALNILTTAEKVIRDHHGRFPKDREKLLALPGIGHYTSGAILSFGFRSGETPAMVDGNFVRVISRLFHLTSMEVRKPQKVREIAQYLIDHPGNTQPRLYNEAMMEVGALICKPQPLCPRCPLKSDCASWKKGEPSHNPYTISKKIIPENSSAIILFEKNRVLLMKNQSEKISPLSFLWRFPTVDLHSKVMTSSPPANPSTQGGKDFILASKRLFRDRLGLTLKNLRPLFSICHHYTQYRIDLQVFEAKLTGEIVVDADNDRGRMLEWRWMSLDELSSLGMSSPDQKIRQYLLDNRSSNH